ncbi:hypothetical protein LY90DRAFT_670286 [Neocallimastix californiae]|uniref:Uncharacterized protein n=1 Tax=Neocallimastix californiae TaxID=1754190 RepID=A0A1Y2D3T0_9FUNG|nr:hypothetical protein LY90DRAFT_670286 [Neocallimastix californiae]|eukprot:ORY53933.1 hypothetical protein LY90DRAFT_670286 [Neocallimastix californiae]
MKGMVIYLKHSSLRPYYANTIGLLAFESLIKDNIYFNKGTHGLLNDYSTTFHTLEKNIKARKYGGVYITDFDILKQFLNAPGCVRSERLRYQCDQREFDENYNEEVAGSTLNFIMTEYNNRLNEFINNEQQQYEIDYTNRENFRKTYETILSQPFLAFHNKIIHDIAGHAMIYNELGKEFLINNLFKYERITFYVHIGSSILLFLSFNILFLRQIRNQLRIVDFLINILFLIPMEAYQSSSNLKNFIEHGKLN